MEQARGEGRSFVATVTMTHVPGTTYQTRIDTGALAPFKQILLDAARTLAP